MIYLFPTLYILILFIISFIHRKPQDMEDFFIANRTLKPLTIALSSRVTGKSAWLILGFTGFGYSNGMVGLWIILGEFFFLILSWYFIAPKFKRLSDEADAISFFDVIEYKIKDNRHLIRLLSMIIILIFIPIYLSAQYTAIGKVANAFFSLSHENGIIIGAIIITAYTVLGGFRAVCYTDLFQAFLILFSLVLISVVIIEKIPLSVESFGNNVSLLSVWGKHGLTLKAIITAISLFSINLGLLGTPILYNRFIAAKDEKTIKKGAPVAIIYNLIIEVLALYIGIFGRLLIPNLSDPEYVFMALAQTLLGPLFQGLMITLILSLVMSTADSLLILLSTSLIRDIYQKLLNLNVNNTSVIRYSRFSVIAISIVAVFMAFYDNTLVFWIAVFAWSGISSSFNPLILNLLMNIKISRDAALLCVFMGCIATLLWRLYFKYTGVIEIIPGFVFGFIALYLYNFLYKTKQNKELLNEIF